MPARSVWRVALLCSSLALSLLTTTGASYALDADSRPIPAQGTLEVAFAPGDDVEGLIVDTVDKARRQVLVQAYILTSKPLTAALVAAHKRGADVRVLVDAGQLNKTGRDRIADLQDAGIKVREETKYKNAHDNCNSVRGVT